MDNIHENLGRISDDLKLIEAFIETRKELTKKLYATPSIMRHGYPVEMKPRSKCMKTRLEYEEKLKQRVSCSSTRSVQFRQTPNNRILSIKNLFSVM